MTFIQYISALSESTLDTNDLSDDSPFLGDVLPEGEARAHIAGRWLMLGRPTPKVAPRDGKNTPEWPASMVADIIDWGGVNPNSAKWVRDVLRRCHECASTPPRRCSTPSASGAPAAAARRRSPTPSTEN